MKYSIITASVILALCSQSLIAQEQCQLSVINKASNAGVVVSVQGS